MNKSGLLLACASVALLCACGGGGGGVSPLPAPPPAPTPTPTPPPPPPSNTLITDLQASQVFTSPGASSDAVFDLDKALTVSGSTKSTSVQVSYDANTKTYSVTSDGRSQSFAPGDLNPANIPGEARYTKGSGSSSDFLTLATTPYEGATSNRYVGLGYWQHNDLAGGRQDTKFDIFAYGLDTPATAVPRTGSANYKTDIFGLLTVPGFAPRGLQGTGAFNVDFLSGRFSTDAILSEYNYITGGGIVGGLHLFGGGDLTSGNGFSGNIAYDNNSLSVSGTISGKFYGPGAEEMGASFSASDGQGNAFSGAMTGQRDPLVPSTNLSLVNVIAQERVKLWGAGTWTAQYDGATDYFDLRSHVSDGFLTFKPGGPPHIDLGDSRYPFVELAAADRIASTRPNFDAYEKSVNGSPVRIELYRPGSANAELALTYASFGTWSSSTREATTLGSLTRTNRFFFLYGLETPRNLLANRTGTASYDGVVYANGASHDGHYYDIGGTSRFDVDFGSARYSGSLVLSGQEPNGPALSFGTWTFGSSIGSGQMSPSELANGSFVSAGSSIVPRFYGPDGQEIGATFQLRTGAPGAPGTVSVSGVTVARRAP